MLICFSLFSINTLSNGQTIDEYTLKAIWLGKFSHFIDWPADKEESKDTFCIGLYDSDPFDGLLEDIYVNRPIDGKPVNIKLLNKKDDLKGLDILFIPESNSKEITTLISHANKHHVLLVSDSKGFAEKGVHINFFLINKKIRFEINESSMRNSGFFVSYRLLNIAKIIEPISSE